MTKVLARYRYVLGVLAVNVLVLALWPRVGAVALRGSMANCREMLMVLPPIFVLLGLLDVWVERETLTRMMGKGAGTKGVATAFLLGSVAAGPLYAAFPIVGVLLKKGSTIANVVVFVGAWTTTKAAMLLFETSTMGWRFALVRLALDIPAMIVIAYVTDRLIPRNQRAWIYANARERFAEGDEPAELETADCVKEVA